MRIKRDTSHEVSLFILMGLLPMPSALPPPSAMQAVLSLSVSVAAWSV
jgi:hypothetical protein